MRSRRGTSKLKSVAPTQKQLCHRIDEIVQGWRPILGLQDWDLKVRFDVEKKDQGACECIPAYEEAVLHYNPKLIRKEIETFADLEELVLHEMVHAVMWRNSERAVSQVTRSLLRSRAIYR